MSPAIYRVRELTVSYKSVRLNLPGLVSGRLSTPRDSAVLAHGILAEAHVEKMLALHVNTKHHLIGVHVISTGTLDATIAHPRNVFQAALLSNAAAFVLVHNHPSGDPSPSPDDLALYARMREAATVLGIDLLDFLIVGDGRYWSARESGR